MFSFNSVPAISRKLIKLSAYESLLYSQIGSLPVDIFQVLQDRDDLFLYDSTIFRLVDGWDTESYERVFGKYGSLIYDEKFNKYFAFYNDSNADAVIRWELTSLLALLELGLASKEFIVSVNCEDDDCTETFSYYFTTPDIILQKANITTPADIIKNCGIPFDKANKKAKKINSIIPEKKLFLDNMLIQNFSKYIHCLINK